MKRIKKENDVWVYTLLLTTLTILIESLRVYTFKLFGVELSYSLFLLPVVYFLIDVIAKKFDYKRAVAAIAISSVIFVSFSFIVAYAINGEYILRSLTGEFCAYVLSAFTNLTIYVFLLNNTESPRILVILTYLFSLVVYYMVFTLIYLNLVFNDYWTGYFITLGIQLVICTILSIVDKRVLRGE